MITSKVIHTFELSHMEGYIMLTAQEYPWTVCQVVPCTPENHDRILEALRERGSVAQHDTDKSFFVIQAASGDYDGKHPERYIEVNQDNYKDFLAAMRDTLAQAAVWYKTNIIAKRHV